MDTKTRLRAHLDELFAGAPHTRAAYELQEELFVNSMEKYTDLLSEGMPAETAYQTVVAGIGNVDEIFAELGVEPAGASAAPMGVTEEQRQKSAVTTAIAIGLYVFAGVVMFAGFALSEALYSDVVALLGLVVALAVCIIPTVMLVYNAKRYPTYEKKEETVVENFKEFTSESQQRKAMRGAVSSLVWTLILIAYFVISFTTGAWAYTWLLFIIGGCIESIVSLAFSMKRG